ncbi:MAG: radical SAM protein [bacterium]
MLLVNPWIVDFAAYDFWIKPLGLLSVGAVLRENGYDVDLLDCMDRNHPSLRGIPKFKGNQSRPDGTGRFFKEFIPKPDILKHVPRKYGRYGLPFSIVKDELMRRAPPDVVLVTSGMTYWYPGVVEMVSLLKQSFSNVPVILGGIYASLYPDHARGESGADWVVVGEGEIEGLRIVDEITGSRSDMSGYRSIDDFPEPAYDLYDRLDSVALLTSRGCPFRCPFCASSLLSKTYKRRSPSRIVDEIVRLHGRMGVTEFAFYDDALLYEKDEHLVPILEEIVKRNLPIHFHTPNGIQPGAVDDRLARLMAETGFRTIRLSYETMNKERQKSMGLKVTDEDLTQAVRHLVEAGFDRRQIGSYILMGLPGQTVEETVESMRFVLSLGIKVSLASFSPIPGTKSWQEAVDLRMLTPNADPLLTNNSIYPICSEDIDIAIFQKLGTLSADAHRILSRGGLPLRDSAFMDTLRALH